MSCWDHVKITWMINKKELDDLAEDMYLEEMKERYYERRYIKHE